MTVLRKVLNQERIVQHWTNDIKILASMYKTRGMVRDYNSVKSTNCWLNFKSEDAMAS